MAVAILRQASTGLWLTSVTGGGDGGHDIVDAGDVLAPVRQVQDVAHACAAAAGGALRHRAAVNDVQLQ